MTDKYCSASCTFNSSISFYLTLANTIQNVERKTNCARITFQQHRLQTVQSLDFIAPSLPHLKKNIRLVSKPEVLKKYFPCCHNSLLSKDAYLNSNIGPLAPAMKLSGFHESSLCRRRDDSAGSKQCATATNIIFLSFLPLSHSQMIASWNFIRKCHQLTHSLCEQYTMDFCTILIYYCSNTGSFIDDTQNFMH